MKTLTFALALGLAGLATAASADQVSAGKCAVKLSADGQAIYQASAPLITPASDVRAVVTDKTKALVMGGSISRGAAKPAAEAAGTCLAMLKS